MKKPRKHAEVIKAWADGAEVEIQVNDVTWHIIEAPMFVMGANYRVYEPDYVASGLAYISSGAMVGRISVTFDGHTGLPKSVELVK